MAGNQVVFRGRNEKVRKNIDEFNETAKQLGEELINTQGKEYLHFYCECSDEKCAERLKVTFIDYKKIHEARDTFVVKPNHVMAEIESVVHKDPEYWVVKKYDYPSQSATELKTSGLDYTSES
jgi:hypothetical protein